jgi:cell wall-associated NlpC family hydrolase
LSVSFSSGDNTPFIKIKKQLMQFKYKILLFVVASALSFSQCMSVFNPADGETTAKGALSKEDRLRLEVADYAEKQLGSSYQYAGRDPRGFDCSGFTYYVLKEFDVKVSTSSRAQAKEGKKIDLKNVKPGDLIFFKRSSAGKVFHVALVYTNTKKGLEVIHSTSRGVVIDNISDSKYWKPKISSARNVLDVIL